MLFREIIVVCCVNDTKHTNTLCMRNTGDMFTVKAGSIYIATNVSKGNRDSSIGVGTGCGLDGRGIGVWFLADRLCGPPSLLSNRNRGGSFPGGNADGAWSYNSSPP
jgi:hypothetical protein